MSASATLAINERSAAMMAEGRQVYRLGLGQSPFPVPESVVLALREHAAEKDYLPVRGLPALTGAVAAYHRRRHGIGCDASNVLIGPGSKQFLFLLQVIHAGELLLPTPSWVSYGPQASVLARKVTFLHTKREERWRLLPEDLDRACLESAGDSRILILNYPDNPTGETYGGAELRALADIARRHDLIVVSDEIYAELNFTDNHESMATHYPEGTIVSAGLSKWCGAGGWRLGTLVFPPEMRWLQDAMTSIASESHTAVSAPVQYAAIRAFEGGTEIEHYLLNARKILRSLLGWCTVRLRDAGLAVVEPRGGFYFLADFSPLAARLASAGIEDDAVLCERMLEETGVALLPGSVFNRFAQELTIRGACVDFDGGRALSAAAMTPGDQALDEAFLREYCGNVVEAIERVVAWSRCPM